MNGGHELGDALIVVRFQVTDREEEQRRLFGVGIENGSGGSPSGCGGTSASLSGSKKVFMIVFHQAATVAAMCWVDQNVHDGCF